MKQFPSTTWKKKKSPSVLGPITAFLFICFRLVYAITCDVQVKVGSETSERVLCAHYHYYYFSLQNGASAFFDKRILLLIEESIYEAVFAVIFLHERHHFLHTLRHGLALDVTLHAQLLHHFFLSGHVRRHCGWVSGGWVPLYKTAKSLRIRSSWNQLLWTSFTADQKLHGEFLDVLVSESWTPNNIRVVDEGEQTRSPSAGQDADATQYPGPVEGRKGTLYTWGRC